jgi:hypothetical protein
VGRGREGGSNESTERHSAAQEAAERRLRELEVAHAERLRALEADHARQLAAAAAEAERPQAADERERRPSGLRAGPAEEAAVGVLLTLEEDYARAAAAEGAFAASLR